MLGDKQSEFYQHNGGILELSKQKSHIETLYIRLPWLTFLSCGIESYKNGFL